jgi:hypothetical protein
VVVRADGVGRICGWTTWATASAFAGRSAGASLRSRAASAGQAGGSRRQVRPSGTKPLMGSGGCERPRVAGRTNPLLGPGGTDVAHAAPNGPMGRTNRAARAGDTDTIGRPRRTNPLMPELPDRKRGQSVLSARRACPSHFPSAPNLPRRAGRRLGSLRSLHRPAALRISPTGRSSLAARQQAVGIMWAQDGAPPARPRPAPVLATLSTSRTAASFTSLRRSRTGATPGGPSRSHPSRRSVKRVLHFPRLGGT